MSSAWTGDGRLLFLIKALGDFCAHTRACAARGRHGDRRGPVRALSFRGQRAAPDLDRRGHWRHALRGAHAGAGGSRTAVRRTSSMSRPGGRARLASAARRRAQAAGVRLHLVVRGAATRDSLFTGERLRAQVPDWLQADVWFCGPANFGDALQQDQWRMGWRPAFPARAVRDALNTIQLMAANTAYPSSITAHFFIRTPRHLTGHGRIALAQAAGAAPALQGYCVATPGWAIWPVAGRSPPGAGGGPGRRPWRRYAAAAIKAQLGGHEAQLHQAALRARSVPSHDVQHLLVLLAVAVAGGKARGLHQRSSSAKCASVWAS